MQITRKNGVDQMPYLQKVVQRFGLSTLKHITVEALIIHTSDNPYSSIIHTFLDLPSWLAGENMKNP